MKSKNSTYDLIRVTNTTIEWMAWESIGREITPIEFHRLLSTLDGVNDRLFEVLDKKLLQAPIIRKVSGIRLIKRLKNITKRRSKVWEIKILLLQRGKIL